MNDYIRMAEMAKDGAAEYLAAAEKETIAEKRIRYLRSAARRVADAIWYVSRAERGEA